MPKTNLETSFKKGSIEMLLLKLLNEQDMYGYQLSQELKKRSDGKYTILEGSMYPILYRLADSNYISYYEKKVGKRQTRIYYHLENSGRDYYQSQRALFNDYIDLLKKLLDSTGDTYESDTEQTTEEIL